MPIRCRMRRNIRLAAGGQLASLTADAPPPRFPPGIFYFFSAPGAGFVPKRFALGLGRHSKINRFSRPDLARS